MFLAVFLLNFLSVSSSYAQLNRKEIKKNNRKMRNFKGNKNKVQQYNFMGPTLDALNYFGDLSPLSRRASTDISFTRPAIGFSFGRRMGPFYSLRGSLSFGTLRGSDFKSADPSNDLAKFRYVRNLSFRNRIKELSITGVFDLYRNENSYITRRQFVPYSYIGIAVFHHNPEAFVDPNSSLPEAGTWVKLRQLGTEGQYSDLPDDAANAGIEPYNLIQISIPFGIGFRYRLSDNLDFSMEMGIRFLFTDYIDDVSNNYVDLNVLNSDLARAMSDRSQETTDAESGQPRDSEVVSAIAGDPIPSPGGYFTYSGYGREYPTNIRGNNSNDDLYFVTTLRVTYILGTSFRKAKFR